MTIPNTRSLDPGSYGQTICGSVESPSLSPRPKLIIWWSKTKNGELSHLQLSNPFLYNKGPGHLALSPEPWRFHPRRWWFPPPPPLLPSNHKVDHKTPPNLAEKKKIDLEWKCWNCPVSQYHIYMCIYILFIVNLYICSVCWWNCPFSK